MVSNLILILVILFFVILAGLFAGAETGTYQLSRLRLRVGIEKRRLSFVVLGKVMRDSSAFLLSMLVGTNLAEYIATSIATFLLLGELQNEYTAELFAMLLTAPVLFVFSELIPKNIFFYRADSLMPCIAPILYSFHKLFTWSGIVPVLRNLSRVFAQVTGSWLPSRTAISAMRRSHIKAILRETQEEEFLSPVQTDIIDRLSSISHISIRSVMAPMNKVQTVDANSDNASVLRKLQQSAFTRLPVVANGAANIVGFINIYDCLSSGQQFTDLDDFIKPIRKLPADTTVPEATNIMQKENQKIVLVTRPSHIGRERPVGIVTMKDLVEELLGELAEW